MSEERVSAHGSRSELGVPPAGSALPPEARGPQGARDSRAFEGDKRRGRARIELLIAGLFALAGLAGFGLLVVYALGGQTQVEGVLLALCLGGIGAGIALWAQRLLPNALEVEPRHLPIAPEQPRRSVPDEKAPEEAPTISRRKLLIGALGGAFAGLAAALAIPVLSLGPAPAVSRFHTAWRSGLRLVGLDGKPILAANLPVDAVVTAFPEGMPGAADEQTVLIHVAPDLLRLQGNGAAGAPNGFVAYSKLCTHAGCPVGLYRTEEHRLICPCHQSTFDVLDGATPSFGPAVRPLPQLPIQLQADGTFVALGDFPEPVGPSFWDMRLGGAPRDVDG